MQTIFVMVKAELGRAYEVAEQAADTERVSEVHSISGQYDLLLKCFLDDSEEIGDFVTNTIQALPGIRDTFTIIAFKAFS